MSSLRVLGSCVLALAGGASPQPATAQDAPVVFVNATVVDVERGSTLANQSIVVSRGRIEATGSAASVRIPRGARRIDLAGRFVIPGLWDMHVHIAGGRAHVEALVGYHGSLFLAHGVTGVRDAGGDATVLAAMDSIGRSRPGTMPRLIHAGEKIGPRNGESWSVDDVRRAIAARSRAGARYIKLTPDYPVPVFGPTLAACDSAGLSCVAHIPPADTSLWLSARGRGSYEHLFNLSEHVSRVPADVLFEATNEHGKPTLWQRVLYKLRLRRRPLDPQRRRVEVRDTSRDRAFFDRVAASGTWITPTLVLHHQLTRVVELDPASVDTSLARAPVGPGAVRTADQLQAARGTWALWTGLVRAMHEARVPMLAGTDFSGRHVPGAILHAELALLQRAGVPPADVLRMATINPARYLGASDSSGTVQPGRVADLVVLRRNPLDDSRNLAMVDLVVMRGHVLNRQALDSLVSTARRAVVALRDSRAASGTPTRR